MGFRYCQTQVVYYRVSISDRVRFYNSSREINAYHTFNERFIVYMINNEAAEKLIIFMMDKAITYRNRKLYVLGTLKKKTLNFGLVIEW